MYTIDKSRFTAEELEQYEALIAKAAVDPAAYKEEMDEEIDDEMEYEVPPETPAKKKCKKKCTRKAAGENMEEDEMVETQKSALSAVQKELDEFKKSVEMEKFTSMAKKYAPLGKKEDELAKTLYNMKKSDEASYNAFVGILDEHLELVKSGVFSEIGKSGSNGIAGNSTVAKIENAATDIQKADPTMSREVAIAKAWENHPELIAEYDAEYNA